MMRGAIIVAWGSVACDPAFRQVGFHTGDIDAGGSGVPVADGWYCDRRTADGRCIQYTGPGWTETARAGACGAPATAGVCPVSDIGGCTFAVDNPLARIDWYYTGIYFDPADATYLRGVCQTGLGIWVETR